MRFGATVQCLMTIVISPLCKFATTFGTFVRFLAGMRSHVHRQYGRMRKRFRTNGASVRFVAGMTETMIFQIVRSLVFFAAMATVSIDAHMNEIVFVQFLL